MRIVGQRQLAAHHTNQLARNRQAQPRALEAAGVRAVALLETVEHPIARRAARRWPQTGPPRSAPAAYWLMLAVRDAILKERDLAKAEFATLRLCCSRSPLAWSNWRAASVWPSPGLSRSPALRRPGPLQSAHRGRADTGSSETRDRRQSSSAMGSGSRLTPAHHEASSP